MIVIFICIPISQSICIIPRDTIKQNKENTIRPQSSEATESDRNYIQLNTDSREKYEPES